MPQAFADIASAGPSARSPSGSGQRWRALDQRDARIADLEQQLARRGAGPPAPG
jgi:hypothetical protein